MPKSDGGKALTDAMNIILNYGKEKPQKNVDSIVDFSFVDTIFRKEETNAWLTFNNKIKILRINDDLCGEYFKVYVNDNSPSYWFDVLVINGEIKVVMKGFKTPLVDISSADEYDLFKAVIESAKMLQWTWRATILECEYNA